jgi:beta-galactosidase
MLAGDMIRMASDGREFWRAEAVGNSDWEGRGVVKDVPSRDAFDRAVMSEKDFMADPSNIRFDALMSLAIGSRGFMNPRWRALQDGPLFDGYGWYGLDGSRTARSEEVKKLALWANDPRLLPLWKTQPVRGQVGLVILDDAEYF